MKNDLDKQIKGLLEDATPADAGFELDRNAVWNRVESKQKAKAIPFRKWISHAAAAVIGILLCLPFLWHHEKEVIKTVTVTKTIPSIQTASDTVFVVQNPIQVIKNQPRLSAVTKRSTPTQSIANTTLQPKTEDNNVPDITPPNNTEQVIAQSTIAKPKVKVLHLVDMENENAAPRAKDATSYALFNKIKIPVRLDDKSETLTMIVSNQFSSKN